MIKEVILLAKSKTIVYQLSDNTQAEMIDYFKDKKRAKTPPYAVFQADESDTVVTLYQSGKVVFQGISADIDAAMWKEKEAYLNKGKTIMNLTKQQQKKKSLTNYDNQLDYYFINSIGSDEVGTGDYFGPLIVTAAYVNKKDIPFLEKLGVTDSKKITDDKIKEIAPKLIKKIPHAIIILNNKDYNKHYSQQINMNKIKAVLHNKAIGLLLKKDHFKYDLIIIDQFVNKAKYYQYLENAPYIVKNLTFVIKAESKCLSVACASIISRFLFLKEMKKLDQQLAITLPKGAGPKVDQVAKEIIAKHSQAILKKIAKVNFKNTTRIIK